MQTSYEFLKATKGVKSRNPESFKDFIGLSASDMFFQIKFVVCEDQDTNEELVGLYKYVKKNLFMLENVNEVADWINEIVVERNSAWILKNRRDQLDAEKRGVYTAPTVPDVFSRGIDMESTDYTKVLAGLICNLPEIYRSTALAFYYNNLSLTKMGDIMNVDAAMLKERVAYIEKLLNNQMKEYCKTNGFTFVAVDAQKIRTALIEIGKMYKYPYAVELHDVVVG